MVTCLKSLAEQVIYMIRGGDPSAGSSIEEPEVKVLLGQLINQKIKAEHISTMMAGGETIPDGSVIGTYSDIAVESYKTDYARCTLPAMPIALPFGMGVWSVKGSDDVLGLAQFIPAKPSQLALLSKEPLLSDVLGQVSYEVKGKQIIFSKDITAMSPSVTTVDIELIVLDASQYGDYDLLPISADIAAACVQEAIAFFSKQPPPDKIVDASADNQTK